MARNCFLPPTKTPTKSQSRKFVKKSVSSKNAGKNTISSGMLKRLEPVFIPKQRLYKRGVLHHKDLQSETSKDECKTPTSNIEIKDSPPKDEKTSAKNKREKQPRKSKSLRRALFQDVSKENSTILDIAEENCSKNNDKQIEDGFKFPEDAEVIEVCTPSADVGVKKTKSISFKKPKGKPSLSKKAKQKMINQSVLDIIRKTQQSIQEIRHRAMNDTQENADFQCKENKKASLSVEVTMCDPNKGIQKSKCTVQQSGSIEEEIIGYQHQSIKSYQDIEDLI